MLIQKKNWLPNYSKKLSKDDGRELELKIDNKLENLKSYLQIDDNRFMKEYNGILYSNFNKSHYLDFEKEYKAYKQENSKKIDDLAAKIVEINEFEVRITINL